MENFLAGCGLIQLWVLSARSSLRNGPTALFVKQTSFLLDKEPHDSDLNEEIHKAIEGDGDSRIADLHIWQLGVHKFAAIISVVAHEPKTVEAYKECSQNTRNSCTSASRCNAAALTKNLQCIKELPRGDFARRRARCIINCECKGITAGWFAHFCKLHIGFFSFHLSAPKFRLRPVLRETHASRNNVIRLAKLARIRTHHGFVAGPAVCCGQQH